MKRVLFGLATAAALAAPMAYADGEDMGVLTCKLTDVQNDIVYTEEEFSCEFKPKTGDTQPYTGQIKAIGVNLSVTKDMTMVWAVFAPSDIAGTADYLKGRYVGGTASVALAAGGAANVLVGGTEETITLQPLSVSGIKGTGVNVGIESFELM
jgi:hypothetical protein